MWQVLDRDGTLLFTLGWAANRKHAAELARGRWHGPFRIRRAR